LRLHQPNRSRRRPTAQNARLPGCDTASCQLESHSRCACNADKDNAGQQPHTLLPSRCSAGNARASGTSEASETRRIAGNPAMRWASRLRVTMISNLAWHQP
jgi:hypothetical protein